MHKQTTTILAAIRKACPELMELKKGCRVRYPSDTRYASADELDNPQFTEAEVLLYAVDKGYDDSEEFLYVFNEWSEFEDLSGKLSEDELEIIGHELSERHLLRAMEAEYTKAPDKYHVAISGSGEFLFDRQTKDGRQWVYLSEEKNGVRLHFDDSLSVEQNLETNPELREFVYQLVK